MSQLEIVKQVRTNDAVRESFGRLAQETFGLSFARWNQKGYWGDSYLPYSLWDGKRVLANVSVNRMSAVLDGNPVRQIQLGTVMTAPDCRGKGYLRLLMDEVLKDWKEQCDGIYLYANSNVLDFYPKFGFVRAWEYAHRIPIRPEKGQIRKLNVDQPADREILHLAYAKSNLHSRLTVRENEGLLMFHCDSFLRDSIFYEEENDAVVIADHRENELICWDVFGGGGLPLEKILAPVALPGEGMALLGFTPTKPWEKPCMIVEDDFLFVLEEKHSIFTGEHLRMPILSHA